MNVSDAMDPSLLQDFLTESSELIEQLDADLVRLESAATADEAQELCNGCFRALHTIKGAASFLGLAAVTTFAHAAEDALNKLRKGEVGVTAQVMDALLQSADVVKGMIEQLSAGDEAQDGPEDLIRTLHAIAEGTSAQEPSSDTDASAPVEASNSDESSNDGKPGVPLQLGAQKLDLLEFMITDLQDASQQIGEAVEGLVNDATREESATHLLEICQEMEKTADFFELQELTSLVKTLTCVASKINDMPHEAVPEIVVRIKAAKVLIDQQTEALNDQRALSWPLDTFFSRLTELIENGSINPEIAGKHDGDPQKLLILDEVCTNDATTGDAPRQSESASEAISTSAQHDIHDEHRDNKDGIDPGSQTAATTSPQADKTNPVATIGKTVAEQTIRVEVSRLESLQNLVGQLVLNKNRILALTRNVKDLDIPQEVSEGFSGAAGDLDHLMSELQVSVMRTRMQPLAKLFDRYPRVIRDMARMTDKKINLEIVGKDTEVDKSVLEQLADPLVHILRNSADHGIEVPQDRAKNGKSETGIIRLEAEHQGSHVRVAITDDGKGLDRDILGSKAVEKGLTTADKLEQLSDEDVFSFIFAAGFSTAKKVSDLSGRGVGMDVVRTNINKLNGTINVTSKKGQGTMIEILIPLTIAIMPAMVVGVGSHLYSIPLQSIVEIVRPEPDEVKSVSGHPVMKLRNIVLPLVDMRHRLDETEIENGGRFAVVVGVGGQRVGLCVDRLIGQQEIVIKPLDDSYTQGGPFSGATIREDGDVCLILDVVQLIRNSNNKQVSNELKAAA